MVVPGLHGAVILLLLVVVIVFAGHIAHADEGFAVLWVWDPPFAVSSLEFQQARDVVSSLGGKIVVKSAWEGWLLRDTGWEGWLRGAGYDLVVVAWARPGYREAVWQGLSWRLLVLVSRCCSCLGWAGMPRLAWGL